MLSSRSPFDILDQDTLTVEPSSLASENQDNKPPIRGGLTAQHLDPISSRNWKSVISWVVFHSDEVSSIVDREGQTALHHACLFRAPLDVIEAILFSCPQLASVHNDEGEIALHWAVRLALPLQVLSLLLCADPKSGFVKDNQGNTPLSLLWDRHHSTLRDVYRIYGHERVMCFPSWKCMMMLIRAYGGESSDIENYPLHAIVKCPCEPSFLRFSTEVLVVETNRMDVKGNLPIHLACGAPAVGSDLMSIVIQANPDVASVPDACGSLPLHLALESGKHWEGGVDKLFAAFPSAIYLCDLRYHFFPFMLAAMSDDVSLSTVYELLRQSPQCLR